jgi:sugar O-acyltransferase (sialic acid O-acetyltransferase NeuD family)
MNLVIIGYSGHSYVCIEIAILAGFNIIGYYDIEEKLLNPYNITYLGSEKDLIKTNNNLFVAIGDNKLRQLICEKLILDNYFPSLVHPSAIISITSLISKNVLVSAGAVINAQAKIGFGCIINSSATVEHECYLSDYVHIAPGAVLAGNVTVGKRSFIGANATIKQGITIGEDVTIGAGAVIINDVPSNSTVVGNPGRIIKAKI